MTQDERWMAKYNEVMDFVETNHRSPSKYDLEERRLYTWLKHNRKLQNAVKIEEPRFGLFMALIALHEQYRRKNQYH